MNLKKKIMRAGLALSLGLLITPMAANAYCQGHCSKSQCPRGLSSVVAELSYEEVSADETAGLIKMREEEKLARDVYQVLAEKWQQAVFSNIAIAEQRHMDAVKSLLEKYDIDDPISDSTVGVFTDPDLQTMFEQLTTKGEESLAAALQVGATIEDLDINDLQEFVDQADNEDIKTIYQNLLKGSRNHLRAFWYQLSLNGGEYEAQYISAEELAAIVTSDRERGRVDSEGNLVENSGFGRGRRGRGDCQRLSADDSQPGEQFILARHGSGNGKGYGHKNKRHYNQQNSEQHQNKGKGAGHGPGDGSGNHGNGPKDGTGNGPGTGDCQNITEAS